MSRPQRIAQYIQRLAYESLIEREEREERDSRPDDAPCAPETVTDYRAWNATAFSSYVPFRVPAGR